MARIRSCLRNDPKGRTLNQKCGTTKLLMTIKKCLNVPDGQLRRRMLDILSAPLDYKVASRETIKWFVKRSIMNDNKKTMMVDSRLDSLLSKKGINKEGDKKKKAMKKMVVLSGESDGVNVSNDKVKSGNMTTKEKGESKMKKLIQVGRVKQMKKVESENVSSWTRSKTNKMALG